LRREMTAEEIHVLLYKIRDELDIEPRAVFSAVYTALLGKERGPRAGFFLKALDTDFLIKRFAEAGK
ncbi:MAG: lysine--tRNA ligase, partial [Thermoplasmata archaeon]|nr:lysine--tRNA ligase [Thermoplasmata archaeon]